MDANQSNKIKKIYKHVKIQCIEEALQKDDQPQGNTNLKIRYHL